MLFDSLTIVGVGLIGGSIGLAAKARTGTRRVVGVGRNPDALARARNLGALDEFTTDLAAGVRGLQLVEAGLESSAEGRRVAIDPVTS